MQTGPDPVRLKDLIARVRAATGPITDQREIEALIALSPWYDDTPSHDPIWNHFVRALRGSIDAAVALAERALPGWEWQVGLYMGEHGQAVLRDPDAIDDAYRIEFAQTPPLALVAALLTALAAQRETGGEHVE